MHRYELNGTWHMRQMDSGEWIDATIPGSVFSNLLATGRIEDPFYRDNEETAKEITSHDYEFKRSFTLDSKMLSHDGLVLRCEGIDTLADIMLNGVYIGKTANMHRTYEFDIKAHLVEGENYIDIFFTSPTEYIKPLQEKQPVWGSTESIPGFPYIRKAHYMFGWDWGPEIPDIGIFRDIYIAAYDTARIDDVYITQHHESDRVRLAFDIHTTHFHDLPVCGLIELTCPDGSIISHTCPVEADSCRAGISVPDPQLWWPNGLGNQPLYGVRVSLKESGILLDVKDMRIGLRTIGINRRKDEWGEKFAFCVNGVDIFAMGANYIPEDNLLSRRSKEKTERLIRDCVAANYNCIRVWGGGLYGEDYFYDLCDEYGLIVWQDFMFACGVYDITDAFTENIQHEVRDNVIRIRHHACLGLWCGNNEMEMAWLDWGIPQIEWLKKDYLRQFEEIIPAVVKQYDPNTFYWPASPSSGGGFDAPNDENRGDVHYWDVWHGLKPFTDYRNYHFRFVSEFGFQSFPCLKTVESFTLPEDRNVFSYVMERHQKNGAANGKILHYLSDNFLYPHDFDSLLYTSQLLQAEAIKYGVEHWRRNRGRCMGSIYWQLNDCWPVASWSSIDSFGRWKALHYFAKKFYAPVLVSANERGCNVELHVSNESMREITAVLSWQLRRNNGEVIVSGNKAVTVGPLSTDCAETLELAQYMPSGHDRRQCYLRYSVSQDERVLSEGSLLFTKVKYFEFIKPGITAEIMEIDGESVIAVKSDVFAKYVEISLDDADMVFDDNYFDLYPNEIRYIRLCRKTDKKISADGVRVRSIADSGSVFNF